jgi:two-component system response regulator FlrC
MTQPQPLQLPVLVVEDDPDLREAIRDTLEVAGQTVVAVDGGRAALAELARRPFALVVSDVRMAPIDGIELLKAVRAEHPVLPVLLMTAYAEVDRAVEAMRAGACDFLLKPFEPEALLAHIARYRLADADGDEAVVAEDVATRSLFALALRVAQTDATVLLTGESGVGKEVVARYLHRHSARARGPFVAINCAAIPDTLLEATLFGYEKGAFTGAQQAQAGKFEQAQNGTLLLDEVTEMPAGLQAKLLRVLQEREVERVGGKKPIPLDIRIVATSNCDMAAAVARGAFREDLYYRLNVFPLPIPALRQRPADIVPIARRLLAETAARMGRPVPALAADAQAALIAHRWPGNVRELANVVQRAMILAAGEIRAADLGLSAPATAAAAGGGAAAADPQAGVASAAAGPDGGATVVGGGGAGSLPGEMRRVGNIHDLEREHILATLAEVNGSRKRAVERLGISERTLRYKLAQYREEGYLRD